MVMMVITIAAATTAALITSTQNTSGRERQGARAFTGSEAGLDLAANAVITSVYNGSSTLPADGTVISGTRSVAASTSVDQNKTVDWTATFSTATGAWTVQSTAVSPTGQVTKLLREKLQLVTQPGGTTTSPIWGYGFVTGGAPYGGAPSYGAICSLASTTTLAGSATIVSPTWINGDVCISGGSNPSFGNLSTTALNTVYIGGSLFVKGVNYAIGTPTGTGNGRVASAQIVGGCWAQPQSGWTLLSGCDANQNLNANSSPTAGSGVQALNYFPTLPSPVPTKPSFESADELSTYNSVASRPAQPCSNVGGSSPFTDNDNVPNVSRGTLDFVATIGSTSWDCVTPGGELKFTKAAGSTPGYLTITGKVFIDGSITFGSQSMFYKGSGTLYVDGTVVFGKGGANFCAATAAALLSGNCDSTWDPNTDVNRLQLAAVNHTLIQTPAPRSTTSTGFSVSSPQGNSLFQGAAYANGAFDLGASGRVTGAVFADQAHLQGDASFASMSTPPDGSIGQTTGTVNTWSVAPHSWRECPAVTGCS